MWLDINLSGQLELAVESFTLTYSVPLAAGLMVEDGGIALTGADRDTAVLDQAKGMIKIMPLPTIMERPLHFG